MHAQRHVGTALGAAADDYTGLCVGAPAVNLRYKHVQQGCVAGGVRARRTQEVQDTDNWHAGVQAERACCWLALPPLHSKRTVWR